ncbi:MAG: DMT family transporter [Treponema sp.]|uniref:EamA family transporter n=1 Tax=Treponema sp. TaxID=166 RepID=UPI00298D9E29|nr:EamA family transporter [Treponema sp.]MCQ2601480.1 DMT family transporter [Treponema sp.]
MNPVLKAVLYIAGVAAMTCGNSIGALFFKVTMTRVKVFSIKNTFKIPTLYLGILCYAVGSLLNILLMHYLDYSTVYPLTSLTCVWTLLFSSVFLGEKISARKLIGIAVIICGAILICF